MKFEDYHLKERRYFIAARERFFMEKIKTQRCMILLYLRAEQCAHESITLCIYIESTPYASLS